MNTLVSNNNKNCQVMEDTYMKCLKNGKSYGNLYIDEPYFNFLKCKKFFNSISQETITFETSSINRIYNETVYMNITDNKLKIHFSD